MSPYRCSDCRKYFIVNAGSAMEGSKAPLRKRVIALHLEVPSLKGVAANRLKRDLDLSYQTAWFVPHRIREGFTDKGGPVDGAP